MATVEAPIAAALSQEEAAARAELIPEWTLKEGALEREFKLRNFREAMAFINRVADAASAASATRLMKAIASRKLRSLNSRSRAPSLSVHSGMSSARAAASSCDRAAAIGASTVAMEHPSSLTCSCLQ